MRLFAVALLALGLGGCGAVRVGVGPVHAGVGSTLTQPVGVSVQVMNGADPMFAFEAGMDANTIVGFIAAAVNSLSIP